MLCYLKRCSWRHILTCFRNPTKEQQQHTAYNSRESHWSVHTTKSALQREAPPCFEQQRQNELWEGKGRKPPQAYQRLQCGQPPTRRFVGFLKGKNSLLRRKNIIITFIFVLYICVSKLNQVWGQEGWILALLWNTVTKDAKKGMSQW